MRQGDKNAQLPTNLLRVSTESTPEQSNNSASESRPDGKDVQWVAFEPQMLRRAVIMILAIWVVYLVAQWGFGQISNFLFIMLLAFLSAIAMEPIVSRLAARGWRRGLATGVVMLGVFVVGAILTVVFGGLFAAQVASLLEGLPKAIQGSVEFINATFNTSLNPNNLLDSLSLTPAKLAEYASGWAGGFIGILGSLVGGLFDLLTIVVFAFYISADGPRMRRTIGSWLPEDQQKVFVTVWDIAVEKTGGFVISKIVLALLSTIAHAIAFYFIGVPYWLPMAILAGITSQFIPTIGTYIGILIPSLFLLAEDPRKIIWVVAFAAVYQQVENYLFMPRVSRWTMDLHPALALASVFLGVAFFGPIGALIGMPIAAAVLAVVQTYGRRYELIPELHGGTAADPVELPHSTDHIDDVLIEARARE